MMDVATKKLCNFPPGNRCPMLVCGFFFKLVSIFYFGLSVHKVSLDCGQLDGSRFDCVDWV